MTDDLSDLDKLLLNVGLCQFATRHTRRVALALCWNAAPLDHVGEYGRVILPHDGGPDPLIKTDDIDLVLECLFSVIYAEDLIGRIVEHLEAIGFLTADVDQPAMGVAFIVCPSAVIRHTQGTQVRVHRPLEGY